MWHLGSSREKKKNRKFPSAKTVGLKPDATSTHQKEGLGRGWQSAQAACSVGVLHGQASDRVAIISADGQRCSASFKPPSTAAITRRGRLATRSVRTRLSRVTI